MAESRPYTVIKVARNEDFVEQIGKHIYFDLVDHHKVRRFRVKKQTPFDVFKEEVAKEFGIPVQYQRFWLWAKRLNGTYRPRRPLSPQEEAQPVGQLREVSNQVNNSELKLFLEVELGQDLRPVPPPGKTDEDILLFFKLYDPCKEELGYVGRMLVKAAGKPIEILTRINKMAGFGPDQEIELYEEIKFEPTVMCEHIDKKLTFRSSQLENGDIICFQKSSEVGSKQCRYPDVPSFLEYVHNRQTIEGMDTFFENLEYELASANSQKVEEALRTVEEALSVNPADFVDSSIQEAFKVLRFSDSTSTLSFYQKAELIGLEKDIEELSEQAAEVVKEKNLILEKESIKLALNQSLESNLIKFKKAKAETEEIKEKIATLQAQVDSLLAQINEEERKKEKLLGEKKAMFEVCRDSKLKLSALGKKWPEYEARATAAEEEEKAVEAEWSRIKSFISSLRKALD